MNQEKTLVKISGTTDVNPVEEKIFKGYSIEELRYHRAMLALKKEFCKAKIIQEYDQIKQHSLLGGAQQGRFFKTGSMVSKLLSGLNYLDYAMLGMSLFNSGKKIFSIFRTKKGK